MENIIVVDFSFSVPVALIVNTFKEKITKWLLYDTYQWSHQEYTQHHSIWKKWKAATTDIEIAYALPSVLDHDTNFYVAVRTNHKDKTVNKISFLIEAESLFLSFQETVHFYNIQHKPTLKIATSIPATQLIDFGKDIGYQPIYHKINIYLIDEDTTDKKRTRISGGSPILHYEMNQRAEYAWGYYWNMAAIDFEIDEFRSMLRYYLADTKYDAFYAGSRTKKIAKMLFKNTLGKPLFMLSEAINFPKRYFWTKVFFKQVRKTISSILKR